MNNCTLQLVGHRGLMARYPENTLPSLQAALDAGADYVEFDIQMSADHQFWLLHDSTLQRTTDDSRSIFKLNAASIAGVSAGYSKKFGDQFSGTSLPRLEQAVDLLQKYPESKALVEIKTESLQHWGREFVMNRLSSVLADVAEQCRVISFDLESLHYLKAQSDLEIGWVLETPGEKAVKDALELQPAMLACDYLDVRDFGLFQAGSWDWMLYDITSASTALEFAARGVNMIETADVAALREDLVVTQSVVKPGAGDEL